MKTSYERIFHISMIPLSVFSIVMSIFNYVVGLILGVLTAALGADAASYFLALLFVSLALIPFFIFVLVVNVVQVIKKKDSKLYAANDIITAIISIISIFISIVDAYLYLNTYFSTDEPDVQSLILGIVGIVLALMYIWMAVSSIICIVRMKKRLKNPIETKA